MKVTLTINDPNYLMTPEVELWLTKCQHYINQKLEVISNDILRCIDGDQPFEILVDEKGELSIIDVHHPPEMLQ